MKPLQRTLLAIGLLAGLLSPLAGAFAQAPPPVPALPDTERRTSYSITSSTCACAVNFAIYGDSTDVDEWIEVWINGVRHLSTDLIYGWSLSSPTGSLGTIPRPITDAILTFNAAQTGTVQIVGARRPRRASQFPENRGVAARDLNQVLTDLYAITREAWDKINDTSGRVIQTQPGNVMGMLPLPSQCASSYLTFDSSGLIPLCLPLQTGSISQLSVGQSNLLNGTNGCQLYDNNGVLGCQNFAGALSVGVTAVNNASSSGCALFNNNGILGCSTTSVLRTKLAAPTTFYVATTGTDTTGCGTSIAPCHSRQYVVNFLANNYDFGGQTVTIQLAHGTYTDGVSVNGPMVGQSSPGQLIFSGDCTSAANTKAVLIQPTTQVNSYAIAYGAEATIQCQKIDHSKLLSIFGGADMVAIGQRAAVIIGNAALYCPGNVCANGYADMTFGCNVNQWNTITSAFGTFISFLNDMNIDPSSCLVATGGNTTNGSATITGVGTTTGLVQYMGIAGQNIPADAFVNSFTSNTVTMACIYTSPCQANATGSSITFNFFGGGQAFLDLGNGAQVYFNTNGDPSYSILINLISYNYYLAGFFFVNDLSGANAEGITFTNYGLGTGACSTTEGLSVLTAGVAGAYFPCKQGSPLASSSLTSTAGSSQVTVGSATGFAVNQIVTDIAVPTAVFTAGSATISVSSATGITPGMRVTGPGILTGAVVTAVSGTTITLGGCGPGPRCVSGNPTYLTESGVSLYFSGGCLTPGTKITGISGTTVGISRPAAASCSGVTLWATGFVNDNSVYQ